MNKKEVAKKETEGENVLETQKDLKLTKNISIEEYELLTTKARTYDKIIERLQLLEKTKILQNDINNNIQSIEKISKDVNFSESKLNGRLAWDKQ